MYVMVLVRLAKPPSSSQSSGSRLELVKRDVELINYGCGQTRQASSCLGAASQLPVQPTMTSSCSSHILSFMRTDILPVAVAQLYATLSGMLHGSDGASCSQESLSLDTPKCYAIARAGDNPPWTLIKDASIKALSQSVCGEATSWTTCRKKRLATHNLHHRSPASNGDPSLSRTTP